MAEIRFYQVTASEVDRALPRLVEKVYSSGKRILIYCSTPERMKQLDTILWTFTPKVFLPHGTLFDMMPESQPVLLSTNAANTNNAKVVVLDQGQELPALNAC